LPDAIEKKAIEDTALNGLCGWVVAYQALKFKAQKLETKSTFNGGIESADVAVRDITQSVRKAMAAAFMPIKDRMDKCQIDFGNDKEPYKGWRCLELYSDTKNKSCLSEENTSSLTSEENTSSLTSEENTKKRKKFQDHIEEYHMRVESLIIILKELQIDANIWNSYSTQLQYDKKAMGKIEMDNACDVYVLYAVVRPGKDGRDAYSDGIMYEGVNAGAIEGIMESEGVVNILQNDDHYFICPSRNVSSDYNVFKRWDTLFSQK